MKDKKLITAEEVANYAVCPEAWRLKFLAGAEVTRSSKPGLASEQRAHWVRAQELSRELRRYAKLVYLLLVALVIIVFMLEYRRTKYHQVATSNTRLVDEAYSALPASASIPLEIWLLLLVLGVIIFVWDLFERRSGNLREEGGLSKNSELVSAKGSDLLSTKSYYSQALGLRSKPDALIRDGHHLIPVDIYPLSNKVQDRHILKAMVHLKLMEAQHKEPPPHAMLLMGAKQRPVRLTNSEEKQRWLEAVLSEMQAILEGIPAVPTPSPGKCRSCDVRLRCKHSAHRA